MTEGTGNSAELPDFALVDPVCSASNFGSTTFSSIDVVHAGLASNIVLLVDSERASNNFLRGVVTALRTHTRSRAVHEWPAPLSTRTFTQTLRLADIGGADADLGQLQQLAWGDSLPDPDELRQNLESTRPSVAAIAAIARIAKRPVTLEPLKLEFEDEDA